MLKDRFCLRVELGGAVDEEASGFGISGMHFGNLAEGVWDGDVGHDA